jgi:flagellar hook assembly protein FlgD
LLTAHDERELRTRIEWIRIGRQSVPFDYTVDQNYPNPFHLATEISYTLQRTADVELTIYNVQGQKVKTLVRAYQIPGQKTISWDGSTDRGLAAPSGVYLYRLRVGAVQQTKTMILVR